MQKKESDISRKEKLLKILQVNFCSKNNFDLELIQLKSLQRTIGRLSDTGECSVVSRIMNYRTVVAERIRFLSSINYSYELKKESVVLPRFYVDKVYEKALATKH